MKTERMEEAYWSSRPRLRHLRRGVIFGGQLSLENVEGGRTVIVIKHVYGERADEVIETDRFGVLKWKNLELRVNGVIVSLSQATSMVSEGQLVTWGPNRTYSMVVGDLIRVPLASPLEIGDVVLLKWVPRNQTLVEKKVTY